MANLSVERVCEKFISAGLIVQITIVFLLVVSEGASKRVSFESLKGICELNRFIITFSSDLLVYE